MYNNRTNVANVYIQKGCPYFMDEFVLAHNGEPQFNKTFSYVPPYW